MGSFGNGGKRRVSPGARFWPAGAPSREARSAGQSRIRCMNPDAKSRVEESVPQPDATKQMSDSEKKALELSGEVEHAHGQQREELAEEAQALEGDK